MNTRQEKTIGVLGGMGPYATLDFLRLLLDNSSAPRERDNFRVLVDNNPKIPSRTRAYLFGEADPVPMMAEGIRSLKMAGADFVVTPCNSAHYFLPEVFQQVKCDFVDMISATANEVLRRGFSSIGVLAGEVTVGAKMYESAFDGSGMHVIHINDDEQKELRSVIEDVKSAKITSSTREIIFKLCNILIANGAQAIVLGCTELQAVVDDKNVGVPCIDSLNMLAIETIAMARRCDAS